jgi:hypothetical protein
MTTTDRAKQRIITYTRDGRERTEYFIHEADGTLRKVGPQQFHRVPLNDATDACTLKKAAALQYKAKRSLRDAVADNQAARSAGREPNDVIWLCERAGIVY